jgi:hypothetical protein
VNVWGSGDSANSKMLKAAYPWRFEGPAFPVRIGSRGAPRSAEPSEMRRHPAFNVYKDVSAWHWQWPLRWPMKFWVFVTLQDYGNKQVRQWRVSFRNPFRKPLYRADHFTIEQQLVPDRVIEEIQRDARGQEPRYEPS